MTITGILLARTLGEIGRGQYAGIVAWYGVGLTLGEIGQSAALTYFTARNPVAVRENVRSARRIMIMPSIVVFVLAAGATPILAGSDPEECLAYLLAFAGIPLNGILAAYIFSFQAFRISTWNVLRVIQPVINVVGVALLSIYREITLVDAVGCLLLSSIVQLAVGAILFFRMHRGSLRQGVESDRLLGYGLRQAASAVPSILTHNLDRLYLSQTVSAANLGQYAVAQSVVSVANPLGNAIASVAFPNFAARPHGAGRTRAEVRVVLRTALGVGAIVSLLAVVSPILIPTVFGAGYSAAVGLVLWIAPAILAQSVLTVMSALLRGRGGPGHASIAQTVALLGTTVAMVAAVPHFGVAGAGLGSFAGSVVGIVAASIMLVVPSKGK